MDVKQLLAEIQKTAIKYRTYTGNQQDEDMQAILVCLDDIKTHLGIR